MREPWLAALAIAAPFALVAACLAVASRLRDDYWSSFDLAIYSALVGGLGVLAVVAYLAVYVLRTGATGASVVPALVVVAVVGGGALFWFRGWRGDRSCDRAHDFYLRAAAMPASERAAALADAGPVLSEPDPCALEGLTTWFGPDPAPAGERPLSEPERLRGIAQLLDAGLPPSDEVLTALLRYHDVAGTRLLMERRAAAAGPRAPFPAAPFQELALRTYCSEESPAEPTPGDRANRAILATLLELGAPDRGALDPEVVERLRCLGLEPGAPAGEG